MREVRVASRGPLARVEGFRGTVHAVFARSVYLVPTSGPLLVIHDAAHGHTPTSCLVDDARPADWGVRPGDRAAGRLGRLRVGDVVLDARHTRLWQPAPAPHTASPAPRRDRLAGTCGRADARVGAACRRLSGALARGDAPEARGALAALVGAGPGLTPSGDDAAVGLLAVLHRALPTAPVAGPLDLVRAIVPSLLHRTTTISAHYLTLGRDGWFGEHLTVLVDACLRGNGVEPALVARVLGIGATSGADALVGVDAGLSLVGALLRTRGLEDAA